MLEISAFIYHKMVPTRFFDMYTVYDLLKIETQLPKVCRNLKAGHWTTDVFNTCDKFIRFDIAFKYKWLILRI